MRKREQDRLVGRSGRQPQPPNRAGRGGPSAVGREAGWHVMRWWRWQWRDTVLTVWCVLALVAVWLRSPEALLSNVMCTLLVGLPWSFNVVLAVISWYTRRRDVRVFRRGR